MISENWEMKYFFETKEQPLRIMIVHNNSNCVATLRTP